MAINALSLGIAFTARDLASGAIARLSTRLQTVAGRSEEAAKRFTAATAAIKSGAILLGAGVVGLLALSKASKAFEEFEVGLVTAGNVMNATTAQLGQLKDAAIKAGIETQFSPTEAIKGLQDLGAAGLSATQAIKTLPPVLDLAAASLGQLSVSEAAKNVVGVLNAFGETTAMAATRVDQLVRVTQLSNFQARDFGVAISQASSQAKAGNQTFESMIATLGLLRNTNLDASSAATSYREAIRRVSGDQKSLNTLNRLGIKTIDKQTGGIKDISAIIAELQPKLVSMNANQRNLTLSQIFGVRGQKTYNAVIAGYSKLLKEGKVETGDFAAAQRIMVEQLRDSEGAGRKAKEAFLKTAAGQRVLLKGSFETFKVLLGETITPVLLPAIKNLIGALNSIIGVFRKIPGPIKDVLANFAGVAAAGLAVAGAIKLMGGALALTRLGSLVNPTGAFASALGRVGKALPLIGIGLIGVLQIRKAILKDEKERAAFRKKRMAEVVSENKRATDAFFKTAGAAAKVEEIAARAANKLLKLAGKSTRAANKSLAVLEKNIADRAIKGQQAAINLFIIEQKLKRKSIQGRARQDLTSEKIRLQRVLAFAESRSKVERLARAQIVGEEAKRRLLTEKDETKLAALRSKFTAGRIIRDQKMAAQQKKLQERLKAIRFTDLDREKAQLRKRIGLLKERREKSTREVERFTGLRGTRAIQAAAAPALEKITAAAPGAFVKRAAPALVRGELPTGKITREQLEVLRTVSKQLGEERLLVKGVKGISIALSEKLDATANAIKETGIAIVNRPQIITLELNGEKLGQVTIGGLEKDRREGGGVAGLAVPRIAGVV